MLSYAYEALKEDGVKDLGQEDFDHVHDLFAAILARGVATQVKSGLHRDFVQYEDDITLVRGRIMVNETIKRQTRIKNRLVCTYDLFVTDSPHNQALKSTISLLIRHGDVKDKNKIALKKVLLYFSDVTDTSPTAIRWDALKYHRNNASYRMLLNICHFIIDGLLLTTESGAYRLTAWLNDDAMHRLYERFVLVYYKTHHKELYPKSELIDWNVTETSNYLPVMATDISLSFNNKQMIIDTKYYSHTMRSRYGDKQKYISHNLYQIFTYVKNKEKDATGDVYGILLYAKTDEEITPDENLVICGSHIGVHTLDLNCEWCVITEQLEEICAVLRQ